MWVQLLLLILEENIETVLYELNTEKNFLNKTLKNANIKEKCKKFVYYRV